MLEHTRSISRVMHEEHMAVMALLERLERFIAANRMAMPDASEPPTARLLGDLAAAVEGEITAHFTFEEEKLFPRLDEGGPSGMTSILLEEHELILPVGERLTAIAKAARNGGFTKESWEEFARLGLDFAERLSGHIDKEEMGMIAAIESVIDEDTDQTLWNGYVMDR